MYTDTPKDIAVSAPKSTACTIHTLPPSKAWVAVQPLQTACTPPPLPCTQALYAAVFCACLDQMADPLHTALGGRHHVHAALFVMEHTQNRGKPHH